jgi:hypothetical protein
MRKQISFAIAAAIVALTLGFWIKAGMLKTSADIVRPTVDFSSPVSSKYLPIQELEPVY